MSGYDAATEARLDEWIQAKRSRDFTTSDAIQAELEAQGVDTKAARPDPRKAGAPGAWGAGGGGGGSWGGSAPAAGGGSWAGSGAAQQTYDAATEAKLDQWVQAKRGRDFTTSDAIQAELEAQGVNCKAARPDPRKAGAPGAWGAGGGGGGSWGGSAPTYDAATEARLDEWIQAKRARDFETSDAIQRELEAQGVDTKAARPDPRKAGESSWGAGASCGAGSSWGGGGGAWSDPSQMMNMMNMMMAMKGGGNGAWAPY